MKKYIISEKEWKTVLDKATFKEGDWIYINKITDSLYSQPYNPQQCEICKNGFCSLKGNKNIQNIPCSMVNNFVKGEQK